MTNPLEFGEIISSRLDALGLSRNDLAKRMRVSYVTIHNGIVGKTSCGKRLDALAELLYPNRGRWYRAKVDFINAHNRAFHIPELELPHVKEDWLSSSGGMTFAGRELSMMVLDYCREGYSYTEFNSELVTWCEPKAPDIWHDRLNAALLEAETQRKEGHINNNPIVALREVKPRREGSGEIQGFHMKFSEINYVIKRAGILFYNKLMTGAEQKLLLDDVREWRLHPILSRCLNTQIGIITSDGKFMFARRASHIINGGKVACGVAETMEAGDILSREGLNKPDVFRGSS